jgi:hypothetical protein
MSYWVELERQKQTKKMQTLAFASAAHEFKNLGCTCRMTFAGCGTRFALGPAAIAVENHPNMLGQRSAQELPTESTLVNAINEVAHGSRLLTFEHG